MRVSGIDQIPWQFTITLCAPLTELAKGALSCNGNGVPDDVDLAGKIYWVDAFKDKIQRADLDGTQIELIVAESFVRLSVGRSQRPGPGRSGAPRTRPRHTGECHPRQPPRMDRIAVSRSS